MRRILLNAFVQIPLLILFSITSQAQWTQTNGPTGGSAYEIVSTPGFIFVNGGAGGVFRSADNGMTWSIANSGLPDYPHCYALTSHGSTIYASIYQKGIYKSTNNGATWAPINAGIENKNFGALFVDGQDIYVGSDGFYYSPNNGASWIQRNKFFGNGSVRKFLICGGKLYAAVNGAPGEYGIYVSENKGETWVRLDLPAVTNVNDIAAVDNTIYIVGGQPTHISRDYGVTWSTSDVGTTGNYLLHGIHAVGDKVYIGGANTTVFYSENEGVDFSPIPTIPYMGQISGVSIINNTLWVSGNEGLFASPDNGATWFERNNGLANHIIKSIVIADQLIYAGTYRQGVFVSSDHGVTWEKRNNGLMDDNGFNFLNGAPVVGMFMDDDDPVVGIATGIFKSSDTGIQWEPVLQVADKTFSTLIGEQNRAFTSTSTAQYYSTNGGENWAPKNDPIFVDRHINGGMIKGDTIVLLGMHPDKQVFISKDFGDSWESFQISHLVYTPTKVVYVNSKLIVATWSGLFISPDFGETWSKKTEGLPTDEVTGLTYWNNDLYVGTTKGVFVSHDQGDHWLPLGQVFDHGDASPLVFSDSFLYSGTYGKSVWALPLEEVNTPPVCTGVVASLQFVPGEPLTIDLNDIIVTDPDSNFPGDFTMTIIAGPNYTVAGNTITPTAGFDGDLEVTIILNDGYNNSREFVATIGVVVGVEEGIQKSHSIYPNPAIDKISVDDSHRGSITSYSIKDCLGRTVLENKTSAGTEINISQLSPGVYYFVAYPQSKVFRFLKKE